MSFYTNINKIPKRSGQKSEMVDIRIKGAMHLLNKDSKGEGGKKGTFRSLGSSILNNV